MGSEEESMSTNSILTQIENEMVSEEPKPSSSGNMNGSLWDRFVPDRPIRSSRNTSPIYKYPTIAKFSKNSVKKITLKARRGSLKMKAKRQYRTPKRPKKRTPRMKFNPRCQFPTPKDSKRKTQKRGGNSKEASPETTQQVPKISNSKSDVVSTSNVVNVAPNYSEPNLATNTVEDDWTTPKIVNITSLADNQSVPGQPTMNDLTQRNLEVCDPPPPPPFCSIQNFEFQYRLSVPYFRPLPYIEELQARKEMQVCLAQTFKNQIHQVMYTLRELDRHLAPDQDTCHWENYTDMCTLSTYLLAVDKVSGNLNTRLNSHLEID